MQMPRLNLIPIALILLLVFLQCRLWFESGGVIDMLRLKKQVAAEHAINTELKQRNQKLISEVQHLQNNEDAIEARARQELGMVKKGETFYQVVN